MFVVKNKKQIVGSIDLLSRFNERDIAAFGEIYSLFYDDLFYYALKLYGNTNVEPQDVVHDTFLKLWQFPRTRFESLAGLKAYLFVALRNEFNQCVGHNYYVEELRVYVGIVASRMCRGASPFLRGVELGRDRLEAREDQAGRL